MAHGRGADFFCPLLGRVAGSAFRDRPDVGMTPPVGTRGGCPTARRGVRSGAVSGTVHEPFLGTTAGGRPAMKTARRKRSGQSAKVAESMTTTFSSDLLTPEEERELLTSFWDCKSELVRV